VSQDAYLDFRPDHERSPGAPPYAIGLTFAEAQAFCEWRRTRLPTEFEWEAALNTPGAIEAPILEWTDSWYRPYPENTYREAEYGTTHHVIRGGAGAAVETSTRRFLSPDEKQSEVGFRCAYGKNRR
jgi:formylglycine-generating enzyme required for sulfatase activity